MPVIRPSADLRNNYGEISEYCKTHNQPVFITINGKGDLAVMSIEQYERLNELAAKYELYEKLEVGLNAIKNGDVITLEDAKARLKQCITDSLDNKSMKIHKRKGLPRFSRKP